MDKQAALDLGHIRVQIVERVAHRTHVARGRQRERKEHVVHNFLLFDGHRNQLVLHRHFRFLFLFFSFFLLCFVLFVVALLNSPLFVVVFFC